VGYEIKISERIVVGSGLDPKKKRREQPNQSDIRLEPYIRGIDESQSFCTAPSPALRVG
jgi:hypothetical protein